MGPRGVERNEGFLSPPGEEGALVFCTSSVCTRLPVRGDHLLLLTPGAVQLGPLCVPGLGEPPGTEGAQTRLQWGVTHSQSGLGHTATWPIV